MTHAKFPPRWLAVLLGIIYSMTLAFWVLLDKVLKLREKKKENESGQGTIFYYEWGLVVCVALLIAACFIFLLVFQQVLSEVDNAENFTMVTLVMLT